MSIRTIEIASIEISHWNPAFPQHRKAPCRRRKSNGATLVVCSRVSPSIAGATIKRQKALAVALFARLHLRPPSRGNGRFIGPQKRSAETRAYTELAAGFVPREQWQAQLRLDVLTVFPNTLLRFYTGRARETSGLSHGYD